MRVALVASSFLPEPGRLERRVDQLARGLAHRGAEVEVLVQGPAHSRLGECDRVTVRCFPAAFGPLRFAVAPKLWDRIRLMSDRYDVVDVHTRHAPLALAVGRAWACPLVFTPGAPMDVLSRPYARATRAFIASTTQIVCRSEIERDLLHQTIPTAARRTQVLPDGVDREALRSARPFPTDDIVVLAVDRLEGSTGVRRAIAAMPSLDPEFRLVVVGHGSSRPRLSAYAADLRVSSRVHFAGAVPDPVLYRWLGTARVVVTLAEQGGSGSQLVEGCGAGASVVASDIPINRWAAERSGGGHVIFVQPTGSPLDVADAIEAAARFSVLPSAGTLCSSPRSWESVVDSTWKLYQDLLWGSARSAPDAGATELVGVAAQMHPEADPLVGPLMAAEPDVDAGRAIGGLQREGQRGSKGEGKWRVGLALAPELSEAYARRDRERNG